MKISIENLKENQPLSISVRGDEAWLAPLYASFSCVDEAEKPLCKGEIHLNSFENFIEISGSFHFVPMLDCGRCAESIPWVLQGNIGLTVDTSPAALQRAKEDLDDLEISDANLADFPLGPDLTIDLAEIMEESVSMAMPVVSTPERDTKGRCLVCQKDCNISQVYGVSVADDPLNPFAKLKSWKSKTKH
ncbi:MAG: YceD family protein [Zetaproteobacteria bacterium]|nr:YceD family protein [Zetaproteobacteria bacterium]